MEHHQLKVFKTLISNVVRQSKEAVLSGHSTVPRGYHTSKWITCYNRSPKHHIKSTNITFDNTNIIYDSIFITLFSTFIHLTYDSTFITFMVPGTSITYDGTLHHI